MSIRLVSDNGEIFWFTGSNWKRLLRFAGQHGWKWDRALIPERMTQLEWNDKYEVIGGAELAPAGASSLADAVERGIRDDPQNTFLLQRLEKNQEAVKKKLPTYNALSHAADITRNWMEFVAFARRSGFRVDLTD
jgi:hypothetical protein